MKSLVNISSYNNAQGEMGTAVSGFSGGGPFTCMSCVHRTPHSNDKDGNLVDSCSHPVVMSDPELVDKKLPDGTIEIDFDDCCRFVRPPLKEGEDNILVYFFRHGETEANADNKFRGFMDFPLDDNGMKDAEESAELVKDIPFTAFYSSDLLRARQTMQTVLDKNVNKDSIKVEITSSGRPWNVGMFAGMDKNDETKSLLQQFADNPTTPIPDGSSLCEFREVFSGFFHRIIQKARECGPMAIFGHASNGHEISHILYGEISVLDTDPGGVVVIFERNGKLEGQVIKNPPQKTDGDGFGNS